MKCIETCAWRSGSGLNMCCEMGYVYCKEFKCADYKTDPEAAKPVTKEEQAKATAMLKDKEAADARLTHSIIKTKNARESAARYKEKGKEMEANGTKPKRKYTRKAKPVEPEQTTIEATQPEPARPAAESQQSDTKMIPSDMNQTLKDVIKGIAELQASEAARYSMETWEAAGTDQHQKAALWYLLAYLADQEGCDQKSGKTWLGLLTDEVVFLAKAN